MGFELLHPASVPEALDALGEHGYDAKVLAGGTAVVLLLQQKLIEPAVLVNLGRVPDLDTLHADDDGLHVGPLTSLRAIEGSALVQERYPVLAKACGEVANVRIRNQATLGGNLAEADYASDPPAALLALDASVTLSNRSGSRAMPLSEFLSGFYTTALEPDELLTEIQVASLPANIRMAYLKYKTRSSEDRPCVGVAVVASLENGKCTDLRVAVGAASETAVRLPDVEGLAQNQELTDTLIAEIAEGYAAQIETLDDLRATAWYRTQMIRVHVRRALEEVRDGNR